MNSYEEIIQTLSECVIACEMCATASLEEENVKMLSDCIKLDRDCADTCSLGVQLLARNSGLSESYIGLCIDICSKCAEECEKHDHDHCRRCAEACRKCEKTCKSYLDNLRQAAMNS